MNKETWFGRCIFLSWYCEKATCKFCFRSTIKHQIKYAQSARRSLPSILTDAIIGKNLGWRIEFLTGGYGIFEFDQIVDIARLVSKVYGQKIWINLGVLTDEELITLEPYVGGICASIETLEPQLHNEICPDKPIEPYSDMLQRAKKLGFKTSITIVIGLGEKKEDFELLTKYIQEQDIDQITFYALKPVQGTGYTESPSVDYYCWWVKKTREFFPNLKIMAGLTPRRADYSGKLLKAGADGLTKFPAIAKFGSSDAKLIEQQAQEAGRTFTGSLTKVPDIDWDAEVDKLALDTELAETTKKYVARDISKMKSNSSQ